MDCDICMEPCASPVRCCACTLHACATCVGQYLCITTEDPHCMQCKTPWSAAMMARCGLPKDFVGKVMRPARERVLWAREQALLPATQAAAAAKRDGGGAPAADVQFVQRCSRCPGFVGCPSFACGMCGEKVCRECRVDLHAASPHLHRCNPDDVASVQALARDTKPCPKCAAPIHRMYGCDQMFCTLCHTAFQWSTGHTDVGPVHNPHFFQWLRDGARAGPAVALPERAVCVGAEYRRLESSLPDLKAVVGTPLAAPRRLVVDLRGSGKTTKPAKNNEDLRMEYLLGTLDDGEFRRRLFVRECAHLRASDQAVVLTEFCEAAADILARMCHDPALALQALQALHDARARCNDDLRAVCVYAGGKPPFIDEHFTGLAR